MALTDKLKAIADAIRAKTGKSDTITLAEMPTEIENISTGGGGSAVTVQRKDVNFVDYDGTLLYSYTIAETKALTEMPPLPTRDGLVCQGWNYELEQIKQYDRTLDVGTSYITDDGKTRLYITIAAEGRMEVPLYFSQTVDSGVAIDWGDGSNIERINQTGKVKTTHIYSGVGSYIISLDVADDCEFVLGHESSSFCVLGATTSSGKVYTNMLRKVEIGKKIKNISSYAFSGCYSLSSIIISQGVTSIGSYAFFNCYSLSNIIIPQGVTSIGSYAFRSCSSLSSIIIPESVTSIKEYTFHSCYSLSSIIIPESVTSIKEYTFHSCSSLSSIIISQGVTSIGSYAFYNCSSLSNIIIPQSVAKIESLAFSLCSGMYFYDFTRHTAVPNLSASNAFNNIPSDCEIRVPSELIDEWKSATNWSGFAENIVAR